MFFLFLTRLRFPGHNSIIKILQRCYGDGLALLDLELLQSYKKEKLIPKFLQFKVANKWLESSEAYLSCQRRLLNQKMSIKYKTI